jgi:exodeoxyribonuclease III
MASLINIWTWNVNGIKNKTKLIQNLLLEHNIDILFVTETKIKPSIEATLHFDNYKCIWNSNKNTSFHGVCFIYKSILKLELIDNFLPNIINEYKANENGQNATIVNTYLDTINFDIKMAHNLEGRILTVKLNNLIIVGTYVPNSGVNKKEPLKRLAYRTKAWDKDVYNYLLDLELKYNNVIWVGDLNVVINDNDVINIKTNIAGTTKEERENIQNFINTNKWIDTWHDKNINVKSCKERATWGVNTSFPLRLDYILCSSYLKEYIISSKSDQKYEGSDHIPLGTIFNIL